MTTIILVPGLWLDASSWDGVAPGLQAAGHDTYPVTLPGLESADADRAGIGLDRRFDVPVTLITSTFPRADLETMIADEHPYTGDLVRISDVSIVEVPTGHWPQLTKPDELTEAILEAVA